MIKYYSFNYEDWWQLENKGSEPHDYVVGLDENNIQVYREFYLSKRSPYRITPFQQK